MSENVLTRNVLLISFSAFFADAGYQGITALFALLLILNYHEPVYVYGIITALAFGVGSFFAYLGGKAGDRFDRKKVSILGNTFIPLMALSGLFVNIWLAGLFFVLGWWARYFRSPARRALLVDVSDPKSRSKIFGFLHALDIAGGLISTLLAILFVIMLHFPIYIAILILGIPLIVSTSLLFFIRYDKDYVPRKPETTGPGKKESLFRNNGLLIAVLAATTFYGFSFYNAGYPVISAAIAHNQYTLGLLAYAVYLAASAVSGYLFGALRLRPVSALWSLGYLPSAVASLLIAATIFFHSPVLLFYIFVGLLGVGMGTVETYEPTATSTLVDKKLLSTGMGYLSVSRSLGLFVSNLVMGIIFTFSQPGAYTYAFAASLIATVILAFANARSRRALKSKNNRAETL